LIWKQTDKLPFGDVTVNYFKRPEVTGRLHDDFSLTEHHAGLVFSRKHNELLATIKHERTLSAPIAVAITAAAAVPWSRHGFAGKAWLR
jgi:hypothetical protein